MMPTFKVFNRDQFQSSSWFRFVSSLLRRVHCEEAGQLSIFSLIVILCMLLSLGMIANVALAMKQKLETQNAADCVTQAATVQMARGMNAITAANHVVGELQSLVVLHHAFGGDALDAGNQKDLTPWRVRVLLFIRYESAKFACIGVPDFLSPSERQFDAVNRHIVVDAAIYDARLELKKLMTETYVAHKYGAYLYHLGLLPFVGPEVLELGIVIMIAAVLVETKIWSEWEILDGVEAVAKDISKIKKLILGMMIPAVYDYTLAQKLVTPFRAENAADEVGKYHQATGKLFPGFKKNFSLPLLGLPVVHEPASMDQRVLPKSQLVRASVPWVQHWRLPILRFASHLLTLSRFKTFYVAHTQIESLEQAKRAKANKKINLLVMKGLVKAKMEKGQEDWTTSEGSRRADRLFCVMGFADREAPSMTAPSFFDTVNKDGMVCFAQGMFYNANPQKPRSSQDKQTEIGWDTLNWLGREVPEWQGGEDPEPDGNTSVSYFSNRAPEPVIQLNWQSMLVPSTRIAESVLWQTDRLGRILDRTTVDRPISRTH